MRDLLERESEKTQIEPLPIFDAANLDRPARIIDHAFTNWPKGTK
jgi:hypothetical protein